MSLEGFIYVKPAAWDAIAPDEIDDGGKLYVQVRGPNGAQVTPLHGWFRAERKLKS